MIEGRVSIAQCGERSVERVCERDDASIAYHISRLSDYDQSVRCRYLLDFGRGDWYRLKMVRIWISASLGQK